jgi:hypothetical protein
MFFGCSHKKASKISMNSFELIRFEQIFFETDPDSLQRVEKEFPFFFPKNYPFSAWVNRRTDSLQLALYQETKALLDKDVKKQIHIFLDGASQYFQDFPLPKKAITITSDVDFNNKVIFTDSLLLIGIDNFLGTNHFMYEDIPLYLKTQMNLEQLPSELAGSFAKRMVMAPEDRSFLAQLVFHGKKQFVKQTILPEFSEDIIVGYTTDQIDWAYANEKEIWNYFVSKELLYSTDSSLQTRFFLQAPFSKFFLNIDQESPGRIGQWLGLQIVKSYQKQTGASVVDILDTPYKELFKKSKYKPRRG